MPRGLSVARGVDLDDGHAVVAEAKKNLRSVQFRAASGSDTIPCAAALPIHTAFLRRLTVPLESPEKARRVLPSLLDIELPFPLESCAHAFSQLERTPQGNIEALAVAARTEDIAAHIERLRSAGFDPILIEHEAIALWRQSLAEIPLAHEQHRLLVYLGRDRTGLVIGSGRGLNAATGLRQGAAELSDPQSGGAKRLALWCKTQCEKHGDATWHIAWCGPAAENARAQSAATRILSEGGVAKNITHKEPEKFLARALAAGLVSGKSNDGNLRTGELAHPATAAFARSRSRTRVAALGVAALVLIALNIAWTQLLTRTQARWQHRLEAEAQVVAGTDRLPRGQELLAAQRAIEAQSAGWNAFQRAREPGAEQTLVKILRAATPYGLTFHNLVIRPQSLLLNGTAADWNDGEKLAAALSGDSWRVVIERSDAGADERVHFKITGER